MGASLLSATAAPFEQLSSSVGAIPPSHSLKDPLTNTNIQLAVSALFSVSNSIEKDLCAIELEIASADGSLGEIHVTELRAYCAQVENRVKGDYKFAGEKLARLNLYNAGNVMQTMNANTDIYLDGIRAIQASLRMVRSLATPDVHTNSSSVPVSAPTTQSYRPFLKKLEPPTFSGRVEDWPEFRSVWKELLSDLPDSIQVQHVKTNLPEVDKKRVAGIQTMKEIWTRLEKVYGDTDLNILTVKSNLENLMPKSMQNYKRVLEVFEAVETATTQLKNLDALNYLQEDFGLMNKLIMKLPVVNQTL